MNFPTLKGKVDSLYSRFLSLNPHNKVQLHSLSPFIWGCAKILGIFLTSESNESLNFDMHANFPILLARQILAIENSATLARIIKIYKNKEHFKLLKSHFEWSRVLCTYIYLSDVALLRRKTMETGHKLCQVYCNIAEMK